MMNPLPPIVSFKKITERYRAIFFDAFGVLRSPHGFIPGTEDVLLRMCDEKKPFWLLTNSASASPTELAAKYQHPTAGSLMRVSQVVSSGMLLTATLQSGSLLPSGRGTGVIIYVGQEKCEYYLREAGFIPIRVDKMEAVPAEAIVAFAVMDSIFEWNEPINRAVNFLRRRPEILLFCPNPDLVFFGGADEVAVGPAALAQLIEFIIGRSFRYFGKPERDFFDFALAKARSEIPDLRLSEILMVGDNLMTDVKGAQGAAIDSLLVLSGNTRAENLEADIRGTGFSPTYVTDSIHT
ncbi:HAD hydrolase-like protein [Bdellovibrionota bacterium FG-1]